ncbi:MAG: glycosyltransferase involved in cell wall biosynthesis [Glaciecola sp.]
MNSRPAIVVATSTYPRWEGDTHPAFVHELCVRLARDVDVTVLAPTSHGAARDEVVDGVHVRRFAYWRDRPGLLRDGPALPTLRRNPLSALQVPTYLAALRSALRRELASRPIDAIHAHWVLPQGTIAARARRTSPGTRLVMTSHGSDVFGVPASTPALRWTLRHADAFTGVSQAVLDRAHAIGLPESTTAMVAPMGVDTDVFRPDPEERLAVRASHGIAGPLVLFAGRLTAVKGIDVLLGAAPSIVHAHPDVTIVIAGTGERRGELEAQAAAAGVTDHVRFIGFQTRRDLAGWYSAADVLVGPSRSEGFGLVFAEALATGCPVVVSDLPAVRTIVDGQAAGRRVPVGDPAALAGSVREVLAGDLRGAALADAARQGERWSWDAAAARYLPLLVPRLS